MMRIKLISSQFSKISNIKLASSILNPPLKQKPFQGFDLLFIRHAQSTFNIACEQYQKQHNIPYQWKQLCSHEGFDHKILLNQKYIDPPITDLGQKECIKIKKQISNYSIDCVLVSPQMRTLQTCWQIFGSNGPKVYVQPLISGPFRCCSDMNKGFEQKLLRFPGYDFSLLQQCKPLWCIDNLPKQQLQLCYEMFQKSKSASFEDYQIQILKLLRSGKISQDALQYRKRVQMMKKKLIQYKLRYKRIALITHYYTIEYLGAIEYEQCGTPKYYLDIKNCTPYFSELTSLLRVEESSDNLEI